MKKEHLNLYLREAVKKAKDARSFFDSIENSCAGHDLVIAATGSTVNDYSTEQYENFLKDKNVFALKQAYFKFNKQVDIHFFNCSNFPKVDFFTEEEYLGYKYPRVDDIPFVITSSNLGTELKHFTLEETWPRPNLFDENGKPRTEIKWASDQYMDVFFNIFTYSHIINKPDNFEKHLFSKELERIMGPGIIHETVFPMAIHLGFKNIYTIGWDFYPVARPHHFYDEDSLYDGNIGNWGQMKREVHANIEQSDFLYYWLKDRGVKLQTIGSKSCVSQNIPRIDI